MFRWKRSCKSASLWCSVGRALAGQHLCNVEGEGALAGQHLCSVQMEDLLQVSVSLWRLGAYCLGI